MTKITERYMRITDTAALPKKAKELLDCWIEFNQVDSHPTRDDFTFFSLKKWLGDIDIFHIEEDGLNFRMRLNGTNTVEVVGEEWVGHTAKDIDEKYNINLHQDLLDTYISRKPICQSMKLIQRDYVEAYRVLLPVFSKDTNQDNTGGDVVQIFLGLFWESKLKNVY